MVRELNMDTQRQNFWKESIHKEATVRLSWHMKYSKEFARTSFPIQNTEKTLNKTNELFNTKPESSKLYLRNIQSKKPSSAIKDLEETAVDHPAMHKSEMRPVSPPTRKLLYKGFSALGEGRYEYLQKRKLKKPEQKYEFPITSGWEYGWKINNAMKNSTMRPAEFGRTRIVKDSFYRTNGVMPVAY